MFDRLFASWLPSRGRRIPFFVALILLLAGSGAIGLNAAGGSPRRSPRVKSDKALQQEDRNGVRVIIRTQAGRRTELKDRLRQRQRYAYREATSIDSLAVVVNQNDLDSFDNDDAVLSVSRDWTVVGFAGSGGGSDGGGSQSTSPLLATLGLPKGNLSGRGVGVAVIDSGIQPSKDFSNIDFFYDFIKDRSGKPFDDLGHGTHVSGLIASNGALSNGAYPGVAPRARIISLRVLD